MFRSRHNLRDRYWTLPDLVGPVPAQLPAPSLPRLRASGFPRLGNPGLHGAKLGRPEKLVVGVVGDYSFQFTMQEVAAAVQYRIPFVLVMINNISLGLFRQSEVAYGMNYNVDLSYTVESADGDLSQLNGDRLRAVDGRLWEA